MENKEPQSLNSLPQEDLGLHEGLAPVELQNTPIDAKPSSAQSSVSLSTQGEMIPLEDKTSPKLEPVFTDQQAAQVAPPPQPPQESATSVQNPAPKRPHRWKWVLAILLLLSLGAIGGLVPVEKIPLLRNLTYALGFDKADTARMSFLRALLAWTDKKIGLPGNWAVEGESSLFAKRNNGGDGLSDFNGESDGLVSLNNLSRSSGQTSLIDIKALNALQLKRGQALDGIRGVIQTSSSQGEEATASAVIRDDNVNAQTEANRNQGEVFFGSDNSAINRNFKDGYDSVKALAKIKNPHIADGKPIDWLLNTTQQLVRNSPLGGVNRQLQGTHVMWGDVVSLGEHKPHRDLYHAWITSRVSNRTPNLMLKKALVDVGFLGADMPTMASAVLGGGIEIDIASLQEDQEAWKEYLEFERECKEALKTASGSIQNQQDAFNAAVASADWGFPPNCANYESMGSYEDSNFAAHINNIRNMCTQVNSSYKVLSEKCHMDISFTNCDTSGYKTHWDNFKKTCEKKFDDDYSAWKNKEENSDKTKEDYKSTQWPIDGASYTEENYIKEKIEFFNEGNYPSDREVTMGDVVKDQNGGASDYFPKEGNAGQTLIDQLAENKAF